MDWFGIGLAAVLWMPIVLYVVVKGMQRKTVSASAAEPSTGSRFLGIVIFLGVALALLWGFVALIKWMWIHS